MKIFLPLLHFFFCVILSSSVSSASSNPFSLYRKHSEFQNPQFWKNNGHRRTSYSSNNSRRPNFVIHSAGPSKQYGWIGHGTYVPNSNIPNPFSGFPKWNGKIFESGLLYPTVPSNRIQPYSRKVFSEISSNDISFQSQEIPSFYTITTTTTPTSTLRTTPKELPHKVQLIEEGNDEVLFFFNKPDIDVKSTGFNPPKPENIKNIYIPSDSDVPVNLISSFGYNHQPKIEEPVTPKNIYDNPISSYDAPISHNSYNSKSLNRNRYNTLRRVHKLASKKSNVTDE